MVFQFPRFRLPFLKKGASAQHSTTLRLSMRVVEEAGTELGKLLASLKTHRRGLVDADAQKRLQKYGFNEIAHEKPLAWYIQLLFAFKNPFVFVLIGLAIGCVLRKKNLS